LWRRRIVRGRRLIRGQRSPIGPEGINVPQFCFATHSNSPHQSKEAVVPTIHITVRGDDREAMADLVRVHGVHVLPQTYEEEGSELRVDALADESTIQRLTDAGYRVEQHEDVEEAVQEDLAQVGQGDRFAADLAAATGTKEEGQ
jgi:hypothetical protein